MQKGHLLQFSCTACERPIQFSILHVKALSCPHCKKIYHFEDETLQRQLQKFEKLCRQIVDSEEILSNTSVGVNINGQEVKIPYKILLTRLNSKLDLKIDGKPVTIEFRLEPLKDVQS